MFVHSNIYLHSFRFAFPVDPVKHEPVLLADLLQLLEPAICKMWGEKKPVAEKEIGFIFRPHHLLSCPNVSPTICHTPICHRPHRNCKLWRKTKPSTIKNKRIALMS